MAQITTNQQGGPAEDNKSSITASPVAIITAAAFLIFFIAWIPLYLWLQSIIGAAYGSSGQPQEPQDLVLGLISTVFWIVIAVVVIAALRWTKVAFTAWTTADLMLTAVIGAVFGLIFVLWVPVYNALVAVLPDWGSLANGLWFVPAILVPYIIRKPGAAVVAETLAGVLAVLMGSPWGVLGSAIAGLTQGIGAETVFALTGWKRYDWLTLALAGVGAAVAGFVFVWPIWFMTLSPTLLIINFVASLVSVLVIAVVGGKLLGDALLSTGVLNRFAIGRKKRAAQAGGEF